MSGLPIAVCAACGRPSFPARLACAACGGRRFRRELVERGRVEETTRVHRRSGPPVGLASVLLPGGLRIVARLESHAVAGDEVALRTEQGGPIASRLSS